MIIKTFEINKVNFDNTNYYLFYGENEGLKEEITNKNLKKKYSKNIFRYEEKEIIENLDNFFNKILSRSFFEKEELIIISRVTDKIYPIIQEIIEKKIEDIKFILIADILDKKSKLRNFFEKDKNTICIAFYSDTNQTLNSIAKDFFKSKKIPISQENLNILIERCRGSRKNLNNELTKIENYTKNKNKISLDEIIKITNLAENYNVSELTDSCLAKNFKKTQHILNENNILAEDSILIIRTFLSKAKRLLKLQTDILNKQNVDLSISSFKPPIFWKDKEIIKRQIKLWPTKKIENLISEISETELLIKKYSSNSQYILLNFIISKSN